VWFVGVHMDIGGGHKRSSLSDIALLWMKEKAEETGLAFDEKYLRSALAPDALAERHESRTSFYRLLPAFVRPIGDWPAAREAVHESALQRFHELDAYSPRNLARYIDSSDESA